MHHPSLLAERQCGDAADRGLVLDDERRPPGRRGRPGLIPGGLEEREMDAKARAPAGLALHADEAAGLADDLVGGGEAEAVSALPGPRGEAGGEDAGQERRCDAASGVRGLDRRVASGRDGAAGARERGLAGAEAELAARFHGVLRIDREVDEHPVELRGIDPHHGPRVLERKDEVDPAAEQPAEQGCQRADRRAERDRARLGARAAAGGEEPADQ